MEIQAKLVEYLEAFEQAAIQVAPQALDAAVTITRIDGIGAIGSGLIALTLGLFLFRLAKASAETYVREDNKGYNERINEPLVITSMFGFGIGFVGSVFSFITAAVQLLNIWHWAAAFYPEIALARDVFLRVVDK